MKKEVICIKDDWKPLNEMAVKKGKPDRAPKRGEICYPIDIYEEGDLQLYILKGYENSGFQVSNFVDISSLNKQIKTALKAPNPDYRIEKLSPAETLYLEDIGRIDENGKWQEPRQFNCRCELPTNEYQNPKTR